MKKLVLFTFLSLAIGNAEASTSLVGSWFGQNLGQAQSTVVATFLANGDYFLFNEGSSVLDTSGQSGIEYGTYNWNNSTGAFSGLDSVHTTGGWGGLSDFNNLSVTGNVLSIDNGAFTLTSIPSVSNSLLGSWSIEHAGQAQGAGVVTFLADGEFFFAQIGNSLLDPSGQNGIEKGTYTWNSITGAFTDTVLLDTNGEWGLSHASITGITVTGGQVTISSSDGSFIAPQVTAVVPLPGAAWFFMTGFMGFLYTVKKKASAV